MADRLLLPAAIAGGLVGARVRSAAAAVVHRSNELDSFRAQLANRAVFTVATLAGLATGGTQ